MMRHCLLLAVAALAGCASAQVAIKPGFDFKRVKKVAVVAFQDAPRQAGSGSVAAGAFEQGLLAAGYDVMERSEVDGLLRERRLAALDPKIARELGKLLGVDALLMGRVTDFLPARSRVINVDEVDDRPEPIHVQRRHRVQENGAWKETSVREVSGYRQRRIWRRVPRAVTTQARMGLSARLVFVPTGEVLWSGSGNQEAASVEDAASALAVDIMDAVKKTWPSALSPAGASR